MLADRLRAVSKTAPPGQMLYDTPGSYTFVVPLGVTSLVVLAVGGGAGGFSGPTSFGGDGGSLSYDNALSVTAGESLTVIVGNGGTIALGEDSRILRSSTVLLRAKGGGSTSSNIGATSYVGGTGGTYGGGGAAGYSGNGGNGGSTSSGVGSNGTGGGGGGGGSGVFFANTPDLGEETNTAGGGGGGVGLLGEGSSGTGGAGGVPAQGGAGGSGGGAGSNSTDTGGFGGGQGGGGARGGYYIDRDDNLTVFDPGDGASGGVRILWGAGRSYPNNAADV
jgi:hypothetical protein